MLNFSPVFLLCSERSGSNLITRLLDSHPEFCGPPPSHLIRTLALNLTRFGDLEGNMADWRQLLNISARIMQNQLGVWHCQWDAERLQECTPERSVRGIVTTIYQAESRAQKKRRVIIKENRIHLFLPYLFRAFPDAQYIWQVRDPRDMALSWKLSANHPGDVRNASSVWHQDQESFRQIYGFLQDSGRVHRLRYEDILNTPETTLERLCAFLGVSYSPAMLGFYNKHDTQSNASRIANWENLAKPLMADNARKYRDALSTEEIGYIESLCHIEMAAHAYDLDTSPISLAEAERQMAARHGIEDTSLQLTLLDDAERAIRDARQQIIDQINAIPIRFKQ